MTQETENSGFQYSIQILEQTVVTFYYLADPNNSYKAMMNIKPLWKQKCFCKCPKAKNVCP